MKLSIRSITGFILLGQVAAQAVGKVYTLVHPHEDGYASMCAGSGACRTILDAEGNPDGGATGLAACEALCDSQSNCNLINFVPFGATGASGVGRCCPRACTDDEMSTEYSIVADRGGWDIYAVGSPPSGQGDPHIKTWVGEKYDFHGVCDLVMLSNPGFDNGRGMHIHIRNKRTRVWSYISTAAVSIGEEILQVAGGTNSNKYFLNGREQDANSNNSDGVLEDFAGYELKYQRISDKSVEYEIVLKNRDSIVFKTWNGLVSVKVNYPQKEDFDGSLGLFGSYPTGVKLARDNETIISDSNMFGQEWQVIDTEPKLFKESEGPQFPTKCDIPNSIDMRRRLANSGMTMEMANTACALVAEDDKDLCIFDVLATNNIESAGAY